MSTLGFILLFTFLGSIGALIGGFILLSREKFALKISHFLASFAAGVLLGSAFFDLLPEALHEGEEQGTDVFLWALIGIIFFFLAERFIHWFHHHEEYHEEKKTKTTLPLIIFGDTMHNFLDGIVIAATFMVSLPLGITTAIAVFAHEIPQEIGDFGLMIHKGLKRSKIILINIASAAVAILGALLTYVLGESIQKQIPILIALTAGFFIYIATSDLIPEIHHEKRKNYIIYETLLLLFGVMLIWFVTSSLPE
ncbi:MAG: ZIP family metal transporter [Candidatus Levybacteria bacterium]|nr:ZIP family metal transporter [Candidatus Levybacteria bacterium]